MQHQCHLQYDAIWDNYVLPVPHHLKSVLCQGSCLAFVDSFMLTAVAFGDLENNVAKAYDNFYALLPVFSVPRLRADTSAAVQHGGFCRAESS